jgi:hypothetical protein
LNSDQVKVALDHNQRTIDFTGTPFGDEDKKPNNLTEEEEV